MNAERQQFYKVTFMLHFPEENEALSNASRFFLIQCSLFILFKNPLCHRNIFV